MSKKLPTISVTADKRTNFSDISSSSSSHDTDSNDMDYGRNGAGGVTDVEDFDSQLEVLKPSSRRNSCNASLKPKAQPRTNTGDNDVTDVEDYDTESEDDEKSTAYPELKLSLREFLQQGLQNQEAVDNDAKESCEIKAGDFVQAQNLNGMADYLTDCEDYDTDSEVGYGYEKSVCVDLDHAMGDQGRVNIADGEKNQDDSDQYEDVSVISDISDLASAMSDCTGIGVRGMSEDEVLEVSDSGHEEVCQIACSGTESESEGAAAWSQSVSENSLPPIDVAFISASGQPRRNSKSSMPLQGQKNFLQLASKNEEVLTDVEGIDDSAAEDSFDNEEEDEQPIPRAIILASGDDGTCLTDVEDMFCEDTSQSTSAEPETRSICHEALPLPHREVVELKEDKYGDTITNVMPMDSNYEFGIYNHLKDMIHTDSEDYSCADEWSLQHSLAEDAAVGGSSLIENEVIVSNELLKQQQNKRLEVQSNAESVTDVEEIFVAGTNRRKKLKTRTLSKGKNKLLDAIKGKEDGVTDVEDMDLSECGLPPGVKRVEQLKQQAKGSNADKASDSEDVSTDDVSDISEASDAPPPPTADKLCNKTKPQSLHFRLLKDDIINQQHTDVEDVQLPSDAEDALEPPAVPVANSNSKELNDMLNESYTVVHEKSGRSFNSEAEKLHTKGMIRDAHTDVEYVESDESAARGGN
ncbi:uncharacterized protein LOC108104908 [Drosophila eugracilis]|uniref:uncharacterized protein LOC108104908 n=1 Tax=Drosophila eugracilis TaxID=29029 RepID=UPI0007E7F08B|nr:uncharacterized protein LOC108104908 [Drosophila eugracilis]XP_041675566.1 uncharacterized protein LOC108104908 [Drosophila eugracilis]XP_041675569.1 uncharacterized protein LOC108104908 [Drosophila eugracilis]